MVDLLLTTTSCSALLGPGSTRRSHGSPPLNAPRTGLVCSRGSLHAGACYRRTQARCRRARQSETSRRRDPSSSNRVASGPKCSSPRSAWRRPPDERSGRYQQPLGSPPVLAGTTWPPTGPSSPGQRRRSPGQAVDRRRGGADELLEHGRTHAHHPHCPCDSRSQSLGTDGRFDGDAVRGCLRWVEELGFFESAWAQEQVIGAAGGLAALETLPTPHLTLVQRARLRLLRQTPVRALGAASASVVEAAASFKSTAATRAPAVRALRREPPDMRLAHTAGAASHDHGPAGHSAASHFTRSHLVLLPSIRHSASMIFHGDRSCRQRHAPNRRRHAERWGVHSSS
jgi:hypothetical protein